MHAHKLFSWIYIFLSCDFRSHQFSKIAGCRHIITLIILEMILLVQKSPSLTTWDGARSRRKWGKLPSTGGRRISEPSTVLSDCTLFFPLQCPNPKRSGYFFSHEKWKTYPKCIQETVILEIHPFSTEAWLWEDTGHHPKNVVQGAITCHHTSPRFTLVSSEVCFTSVHFWGS